MNIIIIGSSVAGINAAKRAKRLNEKAHVTLIDEVKHSCYPKTALPLYASGLIKSLENIYSKEESELENIYNIKLLNFHKALEINKEEKKVSVKNLHSDRIFDIKYDKVIIASGASFHLPKAMPKKASNAFVLNNLEDAISIKEFIDKSSVKDIIIFGYNFYSVISANNFIKQGFSVTIIDKKPFSLEYFDTEYNHLINLELLKHNVKLYQNFTVKKFIKNDKDRVNKIELNNDEEIKANMILFFDDFRPNVELAKKSGIELGESTGRIKVNEKLQTNDKNIFACGSVAETIHYISKKPCRPLLASTAYLQGRISGSNSCGNEEIFKGTLCSKIFKIENTKIGATGLNLNQAENLQMNVTSASIYTGESDRYLSTNEKLNIKIVYKKDDKKIIGAQLYGNSTDINKRIDIFSSFIYAGLTIEDISNLDFCYLPELASQKNSINTIGMIAQNQEHGVTASINLKNFNFDNIFILDIRNQSEYKKSHVDKSVWIPLEEIRKRINEIPKDRNIYIYDNTGKKSYIAERILRGSGYDNVFNIEGGLNSIKLFENM